MATHGNSRGGEEHLQPSQQDNNYIYLASLHAQDDMAVGRLDSETMHDERCWYCARASAQEATLP